MRLFLVRHGETVDNVAQVYAGSRDSELTNHGHLQATRLGAHLAEQGLRFTHIFSSHLRRAFKTANLVRNAQLLKSPETPNVPPDVVMLPMLMERDFGSYEGKKWRSGSNEATISAKDEGFVDMESKDSMAFRMDNFLDTHLLPLLDANSLQPPVVIIVSHGIVLSVLWRRLVARLPPNSVSLSSDLATSLTNFSIEHLGGWSNTGYLELDLLFGSASPLTPTQGPVSVVQGLAGLPVDLNHANSGSSSKMMQKPIKEPCENDQEVTQSAKSSISSSLSASLQEVTTTILTINGRDHLKGLKRTRGGVGSARYDTTQQSIETFFKRRKLE